LIAVERPAHGLEHHGFLSEQIGDEACAIVIVDPEDLQDTGIAQEGSGALSVGGPELVDILQDGPELDAVAGHQAHGPLNGS